MISGLFAGSFVEASGSGQRLTVRKAVMRDIPRILDLINDYAARGIMLPRTEFEMSEAIRDFLVGVYRYALRVEAYIGFLTDDYPPFRLAA